MTQRSPRTLIRIRRKNRKVEKARRWARYMKPYLEWLEWAAFGDGADGLFPRIDNWPKSTSDCSLDDDPST